MIADGVQHDRGNKYDKLFFIPYRSRAFTFQIFRYRKCWNPIISIQVGETKYNRLATGSLHNQQGFGLPPSAKASLNAAKLLRAKLSPDQSIYHVHPVLQGGVIHISITVHETLPYVKNTCSGADMAMALAVP